MCCVIPPASPSATCVFLMASSSVVFPWSTCPMTVTTGARGTRSSALVSSDSSWTISSSKVRSVTSAPNSRAIMVAVSGSSVVLIVIIRRLSINFFSTSFARTSSRSARSFTVIPSAVVIVRVIGGRAFGITGADGLPRRAPRRPGDRYGRGGGRYPTAGRAGSGRDDGGLTGCDGNGLGPPSGWPVGVRGADAGRAAAGTWRSIPSVVRGRGRGFGSSTRSRNVGGTKRPAGLAGLVAFVTVDAAALGRAGGVCVSGVGSGGVTSGARATGGGVTGAGGVGASTASGGVDGTATRSICRAAGGGDGITSAAAGISTGDAVDGGASVVSIAAGSVASTGASVAVSVSAVASSSSASSAACFAALADLMSLGGPS